MTRAPHYYGQIGRAGVSGRVATLRLAGIRDSHTPDTTAFVRAMVARILAD